MNVNICIVWVILESLNSEKSNYMVGGLTGSFRAQEPFSSLIILFSACRVKQSLGTDFKALSLKDLFNPQTCNLTHFPKALYFIFYSTKNRWEAFDCVFKLWVSIKLEEVLKHFNPIILFLQVRRLRFGEF